MNTIKDLESQRDALLQQFAELGELRPGNLSVFHRKCYKPNCHCANPDDPGHPGWQLTRKDENQKTIRHNIPHDWVETTQQQLAEFERFRDLIKRFSVVNDQLCQAHIQVDGVKERRIQATARVVRDRTCA